MSLVLEEQVKPLSAKERQRLKKLEGVISKNLEGFVAVCMAFAEIQEKMLYRDAALTIAEYARERFDLSRSRFFQFADGGRLLQFIEESTTVDSPWQPKNEAQLRPLIPVFNKTPDKLAEIIEMAVETAPEGKVTAAHLSKTVKDKAGQVVKKAVKKAKKTVVKSEHVSEEFTKTYDALMKVVQQEYDSDWATTDKEVVIRSLKGLLAVIEVG
ncbi:MAG: hypothetical protein ABFS18_01985 [Thermodesulfobacteriota bacterium]